MEINSGIEADKAAREFTVPVASAYRLSTRKFTLSAIKMMWLKSVIKTQAEAKKIVA
jgi:hypothetical protein